MCARARENGQKKSPRPGSLRKNRQKKKQPLTVIRPFFHTVRGYFSVFLVSNILVTSLSSDFCCCVVTGTRNRHIVGVLCPILKSEVLLGRRSRWRIPSSFHTLPIHGPCLYG